SSACGHRLPAFDAPAARKFPPPDSRSISPRKAGRLCGAAKVKLSISPPRSALHGWPTMLTINEPGHPTRRGFLRLGTLTLGGLTLGDVLRLRAETSAKSRQKSLIMIHLSGGPSHLDMYDMKPAAPSEYRGEFKPIKTNVPGIEICELMPGQ